MATLPLEVYIAARYVLTNIKQSIIIMLSVGMGVAIIIFIPSVNLSFFESFLRETVENMPHIQVSREIDTLERNRAAIKQQIRPGERLLISDQTLTRRRNIQAYRQWMDRLMTVPGVIDVAPSVSEQVIIAKGTQVRSASLRGILPEREKAVSNLEEKIEQGRFEALTNEQVFVGKRLADELNVGVGNRVVLVTAYGRKSFKIAGLVNTGVYATDMSTVLLTLESAQQVLNLQNAVTTIGLRLSDIYQAKTIAEQIHDAYGLKTRSWMEDNKIFLDQISNFRVIISVISFLIILAAASSITSVLIMVVSSKSKEIGILKAMGMGRWTIVRLFLIQAVTLSLLGAAAGVVLGIGIIALYNASPFAKADTFIGIEREPVTINLEFTIYAVVYCILSSIFSSIIPSWQAGKLDPVKAINQN
jgi:lipoprotein-releasing system permease protein